MNKKEQLAEQIAEKHLGKKNFQYYGTLQKQGVIAAIVEAMGVQQVNTCEHRWQFDEEIEGAKYCKECGKIIEAPAKAVEAMPDEQIKKELVAYFGDYAQAEMAYSICFNRQAVEATDSLPAKKDNSITNNLKP
jgi:predicted RNA-binding protein with PUA domain